MKDAERRRINFDGTIHLGHFLTFAGIVGSAIGIYVGVISRLVELEVRQNSFRAEFDKALVDLRSSDTQIRNDTKDDISRIETILVRIEEKLDRKVDR